MNNSVIVENMLKWAEEKLGTAQYAGWCLSFIEDALEISNGIEIFGGSSAKESCEMYYDAIQTGVPERGAFVVRSFASKKPLFCLLCHFLQFLF